MDPSLALAVCPLPPAQADARVLLLPGPFLPVALPAAALPPRTAARLAAALPGLAVDERVRWLLEGGDEELAWALVADLPRPLSAYGRLDTLLAAHAARLQAARGWPAGEGGVVAVGGPPGLAAAARAALAAVREVLAPLPWPRWAGPVAVLAGPGPEAAARPALPEVRLAEPPADAAALRAALAGRLALLALDATRPPAGGWPAWLRAGAAEVCAARARDQGPSPRAMHQVRRAAGAPAIAALLAAPALEAGERPLAAAVCAWLLAERRRVRLPLLLDALRAGQPAAAALAAAYDGADAGTLVRER